MHSLHDSVVITPLSSLAMEEQVHQEVSRTHLFYTFTNSKRPQVCFPFLKLPAELQHRVLQFVFRGAKVYSRAGIASRYNTEHTGTSLSSEECYQRQFSALMLNHRIRHDAISIFNQEAIYVIMVDVSTGISMFSRGHPTPFNGHWFPEFEPKVPWDQIRRIRVEAVVDFRTYPLDHILSESEVEMNARMDEEEERLQDYLRTVAVSIRSKAILDELQICWVYHGALACAGCSNHVYTESCWRCYHIGQSREAPIIYQILECLEYATARGIVTFSSEEIYDRSEDRGRNISSVDWKTLPSYLDLQDGMSWKSTEKGKGTLEAKLEIEKVAAEASRRAGAKLRRDGLLDRINLTIKSLSKLFDRMGKETDLVPDIPEMWMEWQALKSYVRSFRYTQGDMTSLLITPRAIVHAGDERAFGEEKAGIVEMLASHLRVIEQARDELASYD
jgi:hypothetical protein